MNVLEDMNGIKRLPELKYAKNPRETLGTADLIFV
jgi:hypothetical protein